MPFVHHADCPHSRVGHVCQWSDTITSCPDCDAVLVVLSNGRGDMRQRVVDDLTAAKAEAVAAGQVVRAGVIQNMIDRVSAVGTG